MKIEVAVSRLLFALTICFILATTISFTLDLVYKTNTVAWLTACRVALLAVGTAYLWNANLRVIIDPLSVVVTCIILTGAASGLFGSGDWQAYLRHGFQYAFLLVFYLIGRDLARFEFSKPALLAICAAILVGYTVATVIYAMTPGMQNGSYSFQPNLALLPLASGNPVMSTLSAILIAVGNKRAVFLGACFCAAALMVILISKRRGQMNFYAFSASVLGLTPVVFIIATQLLTHVEIPLVGMVANRFSSEASFINTDTKTVLTKPSIDKQIDPMLRITGARNIEVEAIWRDLNSTPLGVLVGSGFGSRYEMTYISPNNYQPVSFSRDQADVMPAHIAMTSGIPLAIAFCAFLLVACWRVFARISLLSHIDRTIALFALSLAIDILLGFTATNPIIWGAVGYATMRAKPQAMCHKASGLHHHRAVAAQDEC